MTYPQSTEFAMRVFRGVTILSLLAVGAAAPNRGKCVADCHDLAYTKDTGICGRFSAGKLFKACGSAQREGLKQACSQLCAGKPSRELSLRVDLACNHVRDALPKPTMHQACVSGYQKAFEATTKFTDDEMAQLREFMRPMGQQAPPKKAAPEPVQAFEPAKKATPVEQPKARRAAHDQAEQAKVEVEAPLEVSAEGEVGGEEAVGKQQGGVSIEEETERVIKIGKVEVDNSRDTKVQVDRDEGRVGGGGDLRKKGGKKGRNSSKDTNKDTEQQRQQQEAAKQKLEEARRQHEVAKKKQEVKQMERVRGKIPQQAVDPSKLKAEAIEMVQELLHQNGEEPKPVVPEGVVEETIVIVEDAKGEVEGIVVMDTLVPTDTLPTDALPTEALPTETLSTEAVATEPVATETVAAEEAKEEANKVAEIVQEVADVMTADALDVEASVERRELEEPQA